MTILVKYVIGHWTGSTSPTPTNVELGCYQELIDIDGELHIGKPVGYTASTGGMNSITYNISCCGGAAGRPITAKQIERFYKQCAIALKNRNLTQRAFYTHAEIGEMCRNYQSLRVGKLNKNTADCQGRLITELLPWNNYLPQNISKIDLRTIPNCSGTAYKTGEFIRGKILWYMQKLDKEGKVHD